MVSLACSGPDQVKALHAKALALGAKDEGAPGPRGGGFYACYFRDLDGNKLGGFLYGLRPKSCRNAPKKCRRGIKFSVSYTCDLAPIEMGQIMGFGFFGRGDAKQAAFAGVIDIVRQLASPAFFLGADGAIVAWNDACEKLTGVKAADVASARRTTGADFTPLSVRVSPTSCLPRHRAARLTPTFSSIAKRAGAMPRTGAICRGADAITC